MGQNLGLKPYTEEEKRKIAEKHNEMEQQHAYGTYLLILIGIKIVYDAVIGSVGPLPSFWILPALFIYAGIGIGILCLFVFWIGDLIRRHRKMKKQNQPNHHQEP